MEENKSWRKSGSFVEALGHAWHGLQFGWGAERNIKIQVGLTLVALVAGWALGLPARDMALIAIASGLVLALEMVNTAIEEVSNVISDSYHHHLAEAKRHQLHIHKRSIPGLQFDIDTELDWRHYMGRLHHWAL